MVHRQYKQFLANLNLNFQKSSGQLEKTAKIKDLKKQIARLRSKQKIFNGDKDA